MTDLQSQALATGLVKHFEEVAHTRMRDMPIVNPALRVEAVGFERTAQGIVGVLITPWFMNLVLLPDQGDDWRELPLGSECIHGFASGRYVFQVAGDETTGRYQTCSLLSPVLEIADQASAVGVAHAALDALHDRQHHDLESSTHAAEVARRWHGDDVPDVATPDATATSPETTMSRRAFLGGRRDDHGPAT